MGPSYSRVGIESAITITAEKTKGDEVVKVEFFHRG